VTRPVSGRLVSADFLERRLAERFAGRLGEATADRARRRLTRWWQHASASIGPASSLRAVFEVAAGPLLDALGFDVQAPSFEPQARIARTIGSARRPGAGVARSATRVAVLVTLWGDDLDRRWREAVQHGLDLAADWCLACNARELRVVDARRTFARRHLAFDLELSLSDPAWFAAFWALCRAEAFGRRRAGAGSRCLLDEVADASAREAAAVSASLRAGVISAVVRLANALLAGCRRREPAPSALLDACLTAIYRALFVLFAEARGLLPTWHAIYREAYALETIRASVEREAAPAGLWDGFAALSRLAEAGCRIADLRVTAFDGPLFASARDGALDRARVPDAAWRDVLLDLTTVERRGGGRERVSFADLGVDELGAVYEHVLDHALVIERPAPAAGASRHAALRARLASSRAGRKASATFYTPRSLTDAIVRRTLAPLVAGRPAADILRLRVVDPAMGSGAFLVSACRFLARAYEAAVVREAQLRDHEIDGRDRAGFRRLVARHCLYGVDLNPMAVHLAKLSLWLATLAADLPLGFLDHHLRTGDSLVGASPADLARRGPASAPARSRRLPDLPLFAADAFSQTLGEVVPRREALAAAGDDSADIVRDKARMLATLERPGGDLARCKAVLDLWCATWFWPDRHAVPSRALYGDLVARLLGREPALSASQAAPALAAAAEAAATHRFFHWSLEFPEVFVDAGGATRAGAGFDAVLCNPPWDMIRADAASGRGPADRATACLARFVRESGIYTGASGAHANRYLLFVERALGLVRPGGRVGMVVPWGLAADHGASAVRRELFERTSVETFVSFDNRDGIFPIHRSVRFLVFTAAKNGGTTGLACRLGEVDPSVLDTLPDAGRDPGARVHLTPGLLRAVAGEDLAVPDLRTAGECRLLERLASAWPPLGSPQGWGVAFGRELNATDDRALLLERPGGPPVVEGRHLDAFRVHVEAATRFVRADELRRRPALARAAARERLAYRDVAAATNRRTLIAAVLPAGTLSIHTVFCSKVPLDDEARWVLCAILNSFVADWLVRLRVSTHVTTAIVERLPVPGPERVGVRRAELARLARRLARPGADTTRVEAEARLQAIVASLYGIDRAELDLVLERFPLVEAAIKDAARAAFEEELRYHRTACGAARSSSSSSCSS
jgi:ADP-ribose pyrophosphatase YjhB (NUDIX family)